MNVEGWMGALVAVSLAIAAAPGVALVPPTAAPPQEVEASYEGTSVELRWSAPTAEDVDSYRVYADGTLVDVVSDAQAEIQDPGVDTVYWVTSVIDGVESPPSDGIFLTAQLSKSEESGPCVQLYLPQTPPVIVDLGCLPSIEDVLPEDDPGPDASDLVPNLNDKVSRE
jgi:hypothetical protein